VLWALSFYMEKLNKTVGIVLTKRDWREDDLLFSILTEDFGKIEAQAIGIKKIKSRLAGHLCSAGLVEILFVQGKVHKKVTHAYLTKKFNIEKEIDFYCYNCILEIVDKSLKTDDYNEGIWQLANWAIEKVIEHEGDQEKKLIINLFVIKLLTILGYQVTLDQKGFYVNRFTLDPDIKALIDQVQHGEYQPEIKLSKQNNQKLFSFLHKYLTYYLENKMNSFGLI